MPELNNLKNEYKDNPQLICLAINSSSNQDKIKEFLNKTDYNFKQFFVDKEIAKELGINAIPRTIVLNKTGKIIYNQIGYDRTKKLENLRKVLSKL